MKWIGEYIQEFVARFRSSVYLEGIAAGTPNAFISVDSNKKIVTGIPAIESVGTVTSGTWRGTEVGVAYGGTGLTSYTQGDILYYNTGGSLSKLGIGSAGEVLKVNSGATAPEWATDASGLSFSGSTSNGLCTYGGSAQVDVESDLTYDSETLTIGADDNGGAIIERRTHSDESGGALSIKGGKGTGTNKTGGHLALYAGGGTGTGTSGNIRFYGHVAGSSSATANTLIEIAHLDGAGNLQIDGGLTTGSTSFVNSSGVVQVATQGTIDHDSLANFVANEHIDWTGASAGTIHSTNIPTLNQDTTGNAATATTFTAGDKTLGGIITAKGYIIDGDRGVTAGSDGVALHVDSMDITDTSTSGSGTAATFVSAVFENSRLLATNSSVTTTNAYTVYIKGAPLAHTNQTITNAYSLYVAGGNSHFEGTLSCDDLDITGSSNALTINSTTGNVAINASSTDADCIIRVADNSTAGTNVIGLVATGDDSIIRNDEGDFKVQMANNATTTLSLTQTGDLSITGNILPGITYIKILPSDFIPDDAGRPIMIDDTGSDRWLESHSTSKLYASVDIPAGFKATHVDIYGSATSAITVYEADVNSKTVTSKGTGNIGTQIDITDVNSDATNYILIELAQASGEEVYGGKLTIAKI